MSEIALFISELNHLTSLFTQRSTVFKYFNGPEHLDWARHEIDLTGRLKVLLKNRARSNCLENQSKK
jgi:hypothetical protein